MAKKELFQSVLNKMLEEIRLDALGCLQSPPEAEVASYNTEDLSDKALEYHAKGEVGTYLYYLCLLEIKTLEEDLKSEPKDEKKDVDTKSS